MNYQLEITPFWIIWANADGIYSLGDKVLFKNKDGFDVGRIIGHQIDEMVSIGAEILRPLHNEDLSKLESLKEYEKECMIECRKAINEFNLNMKVVYTHCQFDKERLIFYFTAERKMEFRKFHRYISQKLNKRVVIKQIGTRDFVRYLGGLGPCGRNICCASFLKRLKSIPLSMAREQKIFVAPSKLSGICGKLLCCLNFEAEFYSDLQAPNPLVESNSDDKDEFEEV